MSIKVHGHGRHPEMSMLTDTNSCIPDDCSTAIIKSEIDVIAFVRSPHGIVVTVGPCHKGLRGIRVRTLIKVTNICGVPSTLWLNINL